MGYQELRRAAEKNTTFDNIGVVYAILALAEAIRESSVISRDSDNRAATASKDTVLPASEPVNNSALNYARGVINATLASLNDESASDEPDAEKKTPEEWGRALGTIVADPDGWRTNTAPPFNQPITLEEFVRRCERSTVRFVPKK